jgi:hypothetical protein
MGPAPRSEMLRTAVSWLQTAGGFAQIRTHFSPIAPADLRFSLRAEREEAMGSSGRTPFWLQTYREGPNPAGNFVGSAEGETRKVNKNGQASKTKRHSLHYHGNVDIGKLSAVSYTHTVHGSVACLLPLRPRLVQSMMPAAISAFRACAGTPRSLLSDTLFRVGVDVCC